MGCKERHKGHLIFRTSKWVNEPGTGTTKEKKVRVSVNGRSELLRLKVVQEF